MTDCFLAGAAILDVLLRPVSPEVFASGSHPVDGIRLTTGGDALNEATVLARLGRRPALCTDLGADAAARLISAHCECEGITLLSRVDASVDTGVNAVLVDAAGERSFITNRNGTLRRLTLGSVRHGMRTEAFAQAKVFCLASMFVSPRLPLADMAALFREARAAGKLVCADTTRPKHGETLRDAAEALAQLDVFFANRDEAALLTGEDRPEAAARALLGAGVRAAVVKLGASGCLAGTESGLYRVPAAPVEVCVDTTGAGDTFAAAYQSALLDGADTVQCCAFANAAAAQCVSRLGATSGCFDIARMRAVAEALSAGAVRL